MTGVGVHQVVAGAAPRDAITNHVLAAQEAIRATGIRSAIFCDARHRSGDLTERIATEHDWHAIAKPGDLAIIHYSIDSPAFAYVAARAARTAIHYHNVTPPDLLWRDAPALALQCRAGRQHLGDFVGRVSHAAADSQFNAAELEALGYPAARVIGVLRRPSDPVPRASESHAELRLLFVGRGVPNKCQHDAILAVGALAQSGVLARLRLVGGWGGNRAYLERCRRLAQTCGVHDQIDFLGSVSDEQIAEEYAAADIFICLSEHEGYCVPLLEAMAAELPIVAFAAGAVPETLGNAGLLLTDKRPSLVAEAIIAIRDGALAPRMTIGRSRQLAQHSAAAVRERLQAFLLEFTDEC